MVTSREFVHEIYETDFVYGTLLGANTVRDPLLLSDHGVTLDGAFYAAFLALGECEESGELGRVDVRFIIAPHPTHGDSPVARAEITDLWAYDILRGDIGRRLEFRPVDSMSKRAKPLLPIWVKVGSEFLRHHDGSVE